MASSRRACAAVRPPIRLRPKMGAGVTQRCEPNSAWIFAAVWNYARALDVARIPPREDVPEGMAEDKDERVEVES